MICCHLAKVCQTSRNITVCLTTTFCQKLEKMEHMHGFGRSSDDSEIVNTYIETQVTHCEHKYQSAGCKVHALVSRQPTICDDSRANNCIFCRHATTKAGQDVPGSLISPFLPISLLHPPPTPATFGYLIYSSRLGKIGITAHLLFLFSTEMKQVKNQSEARFFWPLWLYL